MEQKKILLGNEAIAYGARDAGVKVVSSYPGTPSTEITETIATMDGIYAEWAANEKVAAEVAFGAAVAGTRSMCCMKHVGLNVAADLLFTAAYTGVNAGFVLVVADDPGMYSSQNEQDTRMVAMSAHVPVLEPADSQEAYDYVRLAFEMSEACDLPVIVRMTMRVSHTRGMVQTCPAKVVEKKPYEKRPDKYVMMPAYARGRKPQLMMNLEKAIAFAKEHQINRVEQGDSPIGIYCSGGIYPCVKEAMPHAAICKLGMPYPLEVPLVWFFAKEKQELYVVEELEPMLENQLNTLHIFPKGKEIFTKYGEYTPALVRCAIEGKEQPKTQQEGLPVRPPALCAGCPHRAAYTVIKRMKLTAFGDIGCYTLGANPPLKAIDTTICMGASVGMVQGASWATNGDMAKNCIAVIGDSTFFHGGLASLASACYNRATITVLVLDNGTTGMTGHQDNPATGMTLQGQKVRPIPIEDLAMAMGATSAQVVDPFDLKGLTAALKRALEEDGVSVVIARHDCVMIAPKKGAPLSVDPDRCIACGACLKMGCPAMRRTESGVEIEASMCTGCGLCASICPKQAIGGEQG